MTRRSPISVIMPVFQGEPYIGEALRSLLDQSLPPAEIVVVDDGSTDGSVEVVQSLVQSLGATAEVPRVQIVHRANGGPAAARNTGLAAARHDLIAFHDADDLAHTGWLEMAARRLTSDPTLTGVIGRQEVLIEPGAAVPIWNRAPADTTEGAVPAGVHIMNMVVRRAAFDLVGGFDESMRLGEDTDLLLRMIDSGLRMEFVDDVVVSRRVHHFNLTHDAEGLRRAQFEILARRIRRRKAAR